METRTFDFWSTFREANQTILEDKNDWIRVAGGPWIIITVAFVASLLLGGGMGNLEDIFTEDSGNKVQVAAVLASIITGLATFVALIMYYVRIFRYKILGEVPETFVSFEWNIRHWTLIGYSIAVALAFGIPLTLLFYVGGPFLGILGILGIAYFGGRIALLNAIIAIDGGNPIKGSWDLTGGWTWLKLLALNVIVALPVAIVLHLFAALIAWVTFPMLHTLLSTLFIQFVTGAIMFSAIASCYVQLSKK